MAPTILIAGATGNTGRSVTETLPQLLKQSKTFSGHRVLALTRSLKSEVAQRLSKLPGVEVLEKNWVEITPEWLLEQEVVRAFIAPHNQPNQFGEESTFHVAALRAGVKYVVRISTTAANVRPDCDAYYARSHWAIEMMLSTPEFKDMQWTSLQPNIFSTFYFDTVVKWIQEYRKTGKKDTLRLVASEDGPIGVIDSNDVGTFAAHLLALEDPSPHNQARYNLNGPEDITGKQVVQLVEQYAGTKVDNVSYKDMSFVDQWAAASPDKNLILSIKHAPRTAWDGKCRASMTSKAVLDIAAPKRTPADVFKSMLEN